MVESKSLEDDPSDDQCQQQIARHKEKSSKKFTSLLKARAVVYKSQTWRK